MSSGDALLPLGDGHTPLGQDERRGLKLSYITTRHELNEAEHANILKVRVSRRPPSIEALLDDKYLRDLHRAMFGDVWSWAGSYRRLETTVGVDPSQISTCVRNLVDDATAWIEAPIEPVQAIAVRFHHQLVRIHPFPNGNGRHGRLAADYLQQALGQPPFSWGTTWRDDLVGLRRRYLQALRQADGGNLGSLEAFATS